MAYIGFLLIAPAQAQESPWRVYPGLEVLALTADPSADDVVWVGNVGGVHRVDLQAGTWMSYTAAAGLTAPNVRAVSPERAGSSTHVWVGSTTGTLQRLSTSDARFASVWEAAQTTGDVPQTVYTVQPDLAGAGVWIGTDQGLLRVDQETGSVEARWQPVDGLGAGHVYDVALEADTLWMATGPSVLEGGFGRLQPGGGLSRLHVQTGQIDTYRVDVDSDSSQFWALIPQPDALWLGGLRGLFRFDRRSEQLRAVDGTPGQVMSMTSRADTLWMTQIWQGQGWLTGVSMGTGAVMLRQPIPLGGAASFLAATSRYLVLGQGANLFTIDPQTADMTPLPDPLLPSRFARALADVPGGALVGTGSAVALMEAPEQAAVARQAVDEQGADIGAVAAGSTRWWAGGRQGLYELTPFALTVEDVHLEGRWIQHVEVALGGLWLVERGRLLWYDPQQRTTTVISLQEAAGTTGEPFVESMQADGSSVVVVYTLGAQALKEHVGVARVQEATRVASRGRRLDVDTDLTRAEDVLVADGRVWVGGNVIVGLDPDTLDPVASWPYEGRVLAMAGEHLWAAYGRITEGGLRAIDPATGSERLDVDTRAGLPHPFVTDLLATSESGPGATLWVATYAGVGALDVGQALPTTRTRPDRPAEAAVRLTIAPHPAQSGASVHVFVEGVGAEVGPELQLEVIDLLGRRVAQHRVATEAMGFGGPIRLDGGELPPGMYLIRLRTPQRVLGTTSAVVLR